jgi:hypothetical protein
VDRPAITPAAMKEGTNMTRHTLRIAALAVVVGGLATAPTHASSEAARTQYLTFSKPVALPGVALHPGTYVFELPAPDSAQDIVRVTSRDRKTVYLTAYTRTVDRPASTPASQLVSLKEVAADQPMPISVWWSDAKTGRQFIY